MWTPSVKKRWAVHCTSWIFFPFFVGFVTLATFIVTFPVQRDNHWEGVALADLLPPGLENIVVSEAGASWLKIKRQDPERQQIIAGIPLRDVQGPLWGKTFESVRIERSSFLFASQPTENPPKSENPGFQLAHGGRPTQGGQSDVQDPADHAVLILSTSMPLLTQMSESVNSDTRPPDNKQTRPPDNKQTVQNTKVEETGDSSTENQLSEGNSYHKTEQKGRQEKTKNRKENRTEQSQKEERPGMKSQEDKMRELLGIADDDDDMALRHLNAGVIDINKFVGWDGSAINGSPAWEEYQDAIEDIFAEEPWTAVKQNPSNLLGYIQQSLLATDDGYLPAGEVKPMVDGDDSVLYLHTYYHGTFSPALEGVMSTFLASQNLRKTRLIFWTDDEWLNSTDIRKRAAAQKFRWTPNRSIEIRKIDWQQLARKSASCWKDRIEFMLRKPLEDETGLTSWTNVLRALLLNVYGGSWIDSDFFTISDFRLLAHRVGPHIMGSCWGERLPDFAATTQFQCNNNVLMAVGSHARSELVEASCDISIHPVGKVQTTWTAEELEATDFKEKWQWAYDYPVYDDGSVLKPFWYWYYNDGLQKHCLKKQTCPFLYVDMGIGDPSWAEFSDLYGMCDRDNGGSAHYTRRLWEALRRASSEGEARGFWRHNAETLDLNSTILGVHHRDRGCRTNGAANRGAIAVLPERAERASHPDARHVPLLPMAWTLSDALNPMENALLLRGAEIPFLAVFIVTSPAGNVRNHLRAQFHAWLRRRGPTAPSIRLFFIVPVAEDTTGEKSQYKTSVSTYGLLLNDVHVHRDTLIVGPMDYKPAKRKLNFDKDKKQFVQADKHDSQKKIKYVRSYSAGEYGKLFGVERGYASNGLLSTPMELGLMRWAGAFDSYFGLFIQQEFVALNFPTLEMIVDRLSRAMATGFDPRQASNRGTLVHLPVDEGFSWRLAPELNYNGNSTIAGDAVDDEGVAALKGISFKTWKIGQPQIEGYSDSTVEAWLASRALFPFLLAKENPLFRFAWTTVLGNEDVTSQELNARHGRQTKAWDHRVTPFILEQRFPYNEVNLLETDDGPLHPLVGRISLGENQKLPIDISNTISDEDLLNLLLEENQNDRILTQGGFVDKMNDTDTPGIRSINGLFLGWRTPHIAQMDSLISQWGVGPNCKVLNNGEQLSAAKMPLGIVYVSQCQCPVLEEILSEMT